MHATHATHATHDRTNDSPLRRPRLVASTVLLASAGVTAGAAAADAQLRLYLDGVEVASAVVDGASMQNGPVTISGSASDAAWSAAWELSVDADAAGGASIDGALEFENHATSARTLQFVLDLPFCRVVDGPTLVGGSVQLSLLADADGGMLSVPAGSSGFTAHAGDAEAASLFDAPFFVFASGSGLMSTSADFGLPAPSMAGPDFADAMAVGLDFRLTGGDALSADLAFVLEAEDPADVSDCVEERGKRPSPDINGDGIVGVQDLIAVIYAWGACGGCPADLDRNDRVDFMDMTVVLGAWD